MLMKSLGLAAIVLACSTSIAAAQGAAATPQELGTLLHKGIPQGGGKIPGGAAANAASVTSGWNVQHCWTSIWVTYGGSATYLFAFNVEGTYFYASTGPGGGYAGAANSLNRVCETGQLYGVYVTDPSTLAFSEIQTKW